MRPRPLIALTLSRIGSVKHLANRANYAEALHAAGADTVELLPGDRMPTRFDALCLTGGGDIDPARYGALREAPTTEVDEGRDAFELDLIERALAAAVPVLGICRGFQLLNVHFGGSLLQHVPGHAAPPIVDHMITALVASRLARAVGEAAFKVNSSHHQAVTPATLAPGLVGTARVGNLVEAFEHELHPWLLGVQWHPERTSEVDPAARGIFTALVAAASREPASTG